MASCITSQWKTAAPQMRLTVNQSTATTTTSTLAWTLEYVASSAANTSQNRPYTVYINNRAVKSGDYSIDGKRGTYTVASGTVVINKTTSNQTIPFSLSVSWNLTWDGKYAGKMTASGSISVPMKDNYRVTYNANGGTGAPGAQTKWAHTALKLSSTKPSRTGYTFQGWATSSGGSVAYQPGGTYTGNAALTLYAVWKLITYTVKYDANGGTGAPGNQTKNYGQSLTLSSTIPTRTNYNFKGWGTSAESTTVAYEAGASYTNNAAITLYAIWELAYVAPRITSLSADRCDSTGNYIEDGTYAKVEFDWATDKAATSIKIEWKLSTASNYNSADSITITPDEGSTGGSITNIIIGSDLSTESIYNIRVTVADTMGNISTTIDLPSMKFLIDFCPNGVSIGKPAELNGAFDINYTTLAREQVVFLKGTGVWAALGSGSSAGYVRIARITIDVDYISSPVKLTITQYNKPTAVDVIIDFERVSGFDPELQNFYFIGSSYYKIYLNKATSSVWDLYVYKSEPFEYVAVIDYNLSLGSTPFTLEWVDDFEEVLPESAIQATDFLSMTIQGTNPKDHNHAYSSTVNTARFTPGWIGLYGNQNDAINATNRKGYIGFDGGEDLCIVNEVGNNNIFFRNGTNLRISGSIKNNSGLELIIFSGNSLQLGNGRRYANENVNIYGYRIQLNGSDGGIYANQAIQNNSDKRFKDNIDDIPDVFVSIWNEISPKIFTWNDLSDVNESRVQFGIIAQDVIAAFEKYGLDYQDYGFISTYTKDNVKYFTVTYDHYHMLTALVVRKQQNKLDKLEKQIQELKQIILNQGGN